MLIVSGGVDMIVLEDVALQTVATRVVMQEAEARARSSGLVSHMRGMCFVHEFTYSTL